MRLFWFSISVLAMVPGCGTPAGRARSEHTAEASRRALCVHEGLWRSYDAIDRDALADVFFGEPGWLSEFYFDCEHLFVRLVFDDGSQDESPRGFCVDPVESLNGVFYPRDLRARGFALVPLSDDVLLLEGNEIIWPYVRCPDSDCERAAPARRHSAEDIAICR